MYLDKKMGYGLKRESASEKFIDTFKFFDIFLKIKS